jgi:hypothetical protein
MNHDVRIAKRLGSSGSDRGGDRPGDDRPLSRTDRSARQPTGGLVPWRTGRSGTPCDLWCSPRCAPARISLGGVGRGNDGAGYPQHPVHRSSDPRRRCVGLGRCWTFAAGEMLRCGFCMSSACDSRPTSAHGSTSRDPMYQVPAQLWPPCTVRDPRAHCVQHDLTRIPALRGSGGMASLSLARSAARSLSRL